jgi:hypothetical protein
LLGKGGDAGCAEADPVNRIAAKAVITARPTAGDRTDRRGSMAAF